MQMFKGGKESIGTDFLWFHFTLVLLMYNKTKVK